MAGMRNNLIAFHPGTSYIELSEFQPICAMTLSTLLN